MTDVISQYDNNSVYYFDIEVFPNFFSALFISEDFKDKFVFYKYKDRNDIGALAQFIYDNALTLVGYNNLWYDDIILKYILSNMHVTTRDIFKASKKIVGTKDRKNLPDWLKEHVYEETPWRSADMLALLAINTNRPSLKHVAIHLEHHRLQDLPKPFNEPVKDHEVDLILEYNENDVVITGKIWQHPEIKAAIELRDGLSRRYGVDLIAANDSKIGNVILEAEYGKPDKKLTRRKLVRGKDLIPPTLIFKTDKMKEVLQSIEELILIEVVKEETGRITHYTYPDHKMFSKVFTFNGLEYKMAKGGLHSDDPSRILKGTKKKRLIDCDVGSYYPALRQRYKLAPGHLDKGRFLAVDKEIIDRRLTGKAEGDKVTSEGLKICINGIFGKYNFQYFWLYDPLCFYQTTIYGQLLLLMLIEMLYLEGIRCVSANTDGIVCEVDENNLDIYYAICDEWQKQTGMTLEYTEYDLLVTLNVNSYMAITTKDKIKLKKDFLDNKNLKKQSFVKGYNAPVVALALQAYFKDGITPEETINNHKNVHDFFYTQKTGGKFDLWYTLASGIETKLQKTNRYYITYPRHGVYLVKRDKTDYDIEGWQKTSKTTRETSIWKGQAVHIMNDIVEEKPPIHRNFYIDKAYEVINAIEKKSPKQSVFDLLGV